MGVGFGFGFRFPAVIGASVGFSFGNGMTRAGFHLGLLKVGLLEVPDERQVEDVPFGLPVCKCV